MFLETFLLAIHFSHSALFYRKKAKKKAPKLSVKQVIENLLLLFEVIASEQVSTRGTLVRKHVNM